MLYGNSSIWSDEWSDLPVSVSHILSLINLMLQQMRTTANDIIVDGGEWSLPAVNVTIPAQPPSVDDQSFNVTRFTYRYKNNQGLILLEGNWISSLPPPPPTPTSPPTWVQVNLAL